METKNIEFKILLVGRTGVGKTSLVLRYIYGDWKDYHDIYEDDCYRKFIKGQEENIVLELLDISSSTLEEWVSMRDFYLCQATHIILLFSLIDQTSIEFIHKYKDIIKNLKDTQKMTSNHLILVGTKSDLQDPRQVTKEQGLEIANGIGCPYFEVSSKLNENVEEMFLELVSLGRPRKIPPFVGEVFGSSMVLDVEGMFNNPILSDLKVIVEDETVYLHKVIVSAQFPTFLEFFDKSNVFHCSTVSHADLLVLTKWIYTGRLSHPQPESLKPAILSLNLFPLLPHLSTNLQAINESSKVPSFEILLNERTLSDITLEVGKMKYFAHEQILFCRSIYFKTMFTSGFQESQPKNGVVQIKDVSESGFYEVLKYIYTDKVEMNENNWQQLFHYSLLFGISSLTKLVEQYLIENTTIQNVLTIYTFYQEYPHQLPNLMKKVKYVVGYYFPLIEETKDFKTLKQTTQQQLREMKITGNWKYEEDKKKKGKENCTVQ